MKSCSNHSSIMERYLQCLIVVLLSAVSLGQPNAKDNACDPNIYKILDQTYRSIGWDTRASDTPLCDTKVRRGWYKFVDVAGKAVEMAKSCPGTDKCGATIPIWMEGTLPKASDGIVTRRLCGMMQKNNPKADCCEYEDEAFVQNCGNFYIYYLNPTLECPAVYCAGTAKRCPEGKWSANNFEPCKAPGLELDIPPKLTGPNVNSDKTFDFKCEITFAEKDPQQVFQVVWTINGAPDTSIKSETLTGAQRVATLSADIAKNYMDKTIGCQVTTYYVGKEQQKNTYTSNGVLFGIQATTLTGPKVKYSKTYKFECTVTFEPADKDQKIEVMFTFDGKEDPKIKPRILVENKRIVALDGALLKGHLNSNVGCQARLVYDKYSITSKFVQSNTYFAGIQITPATGRLEISARDVEKQFTVTSTIPVICDKGPICCLTFKMQIDKASVVSLKDSCEYTICSSDWDVVKKQASITVTVVPSRNSLSAGTSTAVLSFNEIVVSGSGTYIGVFTDCKLNPLSILVTLEAGFTCSATGDPHSTVHDSGTIVDWYKTGDYVLYKVKNRDFTVHVRTWPCWAVTCICGVVVKENNDIVRIFGCDTGYNLQLGKLIIPYPLSPGTVAQRSADGLHYGILLPSGSEVKIDIVSYYMNVYVSTPAYDRGQAVGICGTNDGNPANDFMLPDGSTIPVCAGRCIPEAFTEAWRVSGDASMIEVSPKQVQPDPPTEFCSCTANAQGKSQLVCSPRQNIQDNDVACANCQIVTDDLKPTTWGQAGQKPFVHPTVKAVDPNKRWPNANGVTEAQARNMCKQAMQKSNLYSRCQNTDKLVNSVMDECLGDILFGDTTDALDSVTSSFTSKCQDILAKDPKNFIKGPDGTLTLNPVITGVTCPRQCQDNGKCNKDGKCECNPGWEGPTCQTPKANTPQIDFATGTQMCAGVGQICDNVQFNKAIAKGKRQTTNTTSKNKLKCRIQLFDDQGRKIGAPITRDAISETSSKVTCPVPESELSYQKYSYTVTFDGTIFSNELPVRAYDSDCLNCDPTGCRPKKNVCFIGNTCYENGDISDDDSTKICNVNKNSKVWSATTGDNC